MDHETLKFSDFIRLEGQKNRYDQMTISITEKGMLSLNSKLKDELAKEGGHVQVNIFKTIDLKMIGIKCDEDPQFKFPKTGSIKYPILLKEVQQKGYGIPAKYIVHWNKELDMWIGVLQEVPELPKLNKRRGKIEKKNISV